MWRVVSTLVTTFVISTTPALANSLDSIISSPHRAESAARDIYRNPKATLEFFDVRPNMTVVEIWPGANGWYTEILAPYLRNKGTLYAAHFNADSDSEFYRNARTNFLKKLTASSDLYNKVVVTSFNPPAFVEIAPEGSADRVLTFRSVHSWYMRGGGDERVLSAFSAFYKTLKPGGILGVVEHRLPESRPYADQNTSGYMREDYVIKQAERAGFKLLGKSEINANPADTTLHPQGVWTLPPSLRLGEEQRAHYLKIGESDRMTLKFVKPFVVTND